MPIRFTKDKSSSHGSVGIMVGNFVGSALGFWVGFIVGSNDGTSLGFDVRTNEGWAVGGSDGFDEGISVNATVGSKLGTALGNPLIEGVALGLVNNSTETKHTLQLFGHLPSNCCNFSFEYPATNPRAKQLIFSNEEHAIPVWPSKEFRSLQTVSTGLAISSGVGESSLPVRVFSILFNIASMKLGVALGENVGEAEGYGRLVTSGGKNETWTKVSILNPNIV